MTSAFIAMLLAVASPTDAQLEARVRTLLGNIDSKIPRERWQSIGVAGVPLLQSIADDARELPTHRAKAIDAIVSIAPTDAVNRISKFAKDSSAPRLVRWTAIRGLGFLLPPSDVVSSLKPWLEDTDASVRSVTAETLSLRAPEGGCGLVKARAAKESGRPGLFEKALARCGSGDQR